MRVYTIFSLAKENTPLKNGRIYFFPPLDGTFGGLGTISALIPIIFVEED